MGRAGARGAAGVAARLAIGLTGSCAVIVAEVTNCCTRAVRAILAVPVA